MTRSRTPAVRSRLVSWTMRQRLTLLLTCSMRTATRDASIGGSLGAREGTASRLPGWHNDLNLVQRQRQEAQILKQPAPRRQGIRGGIGNACILGAARIGLTQ
jgi:hypothetical protein